MALSTISGTTGITDATVTSAKLADFTAAVDLNGVELLLDADADTSISADTDDQIDIKIANADHLKILSSSGDTVLKPMVDAKDIIFQQFDGNKVFEINDGNFVSVGGNATAAGQIRIYEDTDNGSHYSGFTVGNLTESYTLALPNADGTSGQALTTNGSGVLSFTTLSANTPSSADGQALGSASLEWSDLFLADSSTIQFGNDQDTILTHTDGAGLTLNSTNKLMFNDASQFIHAPSATVLDIGATDEIELTATLIDVVGNLTVSGTIVSTGTITGTLATASQTNITAVGTLGALTVDDVAIDGKVVTMTGSTSDTAVLTAGTNGTLSIVTTDAAAAAANITITADGTFEADGTTITLDSAGDIVLDADGADIVFKDGGTSILTITNDSTDVVMTVATQDKDFAIKGDDGGSTITPFLIDMSAGGDLFLTGGLIDLKNDGSAVSQIKFYCESSNAHAQTLQGAPHAQSASNVLTLPSSGGNVDLVSTASTATLTNKTLTSPVINTATVGTSIVPASADGATLGTASVEFSDLFLADGGTVQLGNDQDVRIIHNADKGIILKHTATADDKPVSLTLQTGETDMAANDVMGAIDFQAPDEGTGTDAILVAAGIEAVAEGDFSSSSNATSLVFKTGASEAAAGKIKVTSAGHLFPMADDSYDLGGASNQWRNIYTGDLHLSNMSKDIGNIVDGSKGDWTIQEGSSDLFLINNNSGKKYKFNLTEV